MARRPSTGKKLSKSLLKLKKAVWKYREKLLEGTVAAIDPSCISGKGGSKPAYALFKKGKFVEQGILDVDYHPLLAIRLQGIAACVREYLDTKVDLLVIEDTPYVPIRTKAQAAKTGKTYMNAKTIASLKQAIGAIKGALTYGKPVIDVNPLCWYAIAKQQGWAITKEDSDDARLIGMTVMQVLAECMAGAPAVSRRKKKDE
ncbi:MAG: hypothetical protein EHM87_24750 [Burkholderiales bacterium]|nr:MAG: hypothetical protein EHM87_24750 [Burkholderiales bacterium]